jgi:hypothetical protein
MLIHTAASEYSKYKIIIQKIIIQKSIEMSGRIQYLRFTLRSSLDAASLKAFAVTDNQGVYSVEGVDGIVDLT